jgi:aspartate kinase
MVVMKFGGASLKDATSVRKVSEIIETYSDTPLVLVVSAMAKTTNALERLSEAACDVNAHLADERYREICDFHNQMCQDLFTNPEHAVFQDLEYFLHEIRKIIDGILLLEDFPDRTYDRIVSYGELISSKILYHYLVDQGYSIQWADARKLIRTDSDFRSAEVNYQYTRPAVLEAATTLVHDHTLLLTQGFIGSNAEGRTTTLGREGSDYSAAILAGILQAEKLIIWKDVPGLMSSDPRSDIHAVVLPEVNYEQAVSMSFFGATVIHPKTLQPLRNAGIPLFVKSFLSPDLPGTRIQLEAPPLPMLVRNERFHQCRIVFNRRDFSFMDADHASSLLRRFSKFGVQINYCLIAARDLTLITDMQHTGVLKLLEDIESDYQYTTDINLKLVSLEFPDTLPPEMPSGEGEILRIEGNRLHFLKQM